MSSIHAQQPEDTRRDVGGADAVERIREVVKEAQAGFFTTVGPDGASSTRPMNVREVDDTGHLWFLSAVDSRKNADLARDPRVTLHFQGSAHSAFLVLEGRAEVSRDPARIEALWSPFIRTWFTGGKDDPRITVVRVVPTGGYYWDNKHGDAVAGVKMLVGATIGVTLDDSVEGTVRP